MNKHYTLHVFDVSSYTSQVYYTKLHKLFFKIFLAKKLSTFCFSSLPLSFQEKAVLFFSNKDAYSF